MPQIKVGLLSYDFYPPIGGQGVESYSLVKAFEDLPGIETFIISSRENDLRSHMRISAMKRAGFSPLHFSLKASLRIRKIIKESEIDILQVYGGPGGVVLLRNPGIPVVYVANHTYAQQYAYLSQRWMYKILRKIEKVGYHFASRFAAISTTTARSLVDDYDIERGKVDVIPVGVDVERFKPLGREREPESILFVGRLCERKGLIYLVKSMEIIKKEIPGIKLHIVGEGDLRQTLELEVAERDLGGNVIFEGKASEDELVEWYNRVELFVLPSLFEGFGIVCLEAMACGTPVIATRTPGIIDIVHDKPPCALVPPADELKLAEAAVRFFHDYRKGSGIPDFGIREDYDWKSIAGKFKRLYENILIPR